jgi:hypothetical protein
LIYSLVSRVQYERWLIDLGCRVNGVYTFSRKGSIWAKLCRTSSSLRSSEKAAVSHRATLAGSFDNNQQSTVNARLQAQEKYADEEKEDFSQKMRSVQAEMLVVFDLEIERSCRFLEKEVII